MDLIRVAVWNVDDDVLKALDRVEGIVVTADQCDGVVTSASNASSRESMTELRRQWGAVPVVAVGTRSPLMEAEIAVIATSEVALLPYLVRISERKAAEERLLRRETQLSIAQQIARLGSWEWDLRTNVITGSPELWRLLGSARRDPIPFNDAFARVHPDDVKVVQREMESAVAQRRDYEHEYRIVRRGHVRHVHARARLVFEGNVPARMVGVIQDITERRSAEEALARSEERYRAVIEQTNDVIFTTDREGRITSVNRAFAALTGWDAADWIGRHITEWADPDSVASLANGVRRVMEAETVCDDHLVRTAAGTLVTVEVKLQALAAEGKRIGAVGVARDVTLRREHAAQAEREKRLASLGHLASAVAHEFNNVLMSILPFAEVIKRRFNGDDSAVGATRRIFEAVRRGRQVSQDILRFARTTPTALTPVDVREWLASFSRDAEALLGPRYTVVANVAATGDLFIRADRALVDQVARNVVLNARDAMPAGGTVAIDVRRSTREHERVEVEIRDTGTGMSADILDRMFDPLFTTRSGATGLGLSSALQAMVLQEGTIRVSSQPGAGSVLTLVFHESRPPQELVMTGSAVARRRKKILLVEDDEAVGEGLRMLLTDDGFDVRLVTTGSEAGNAANEFSPDVTVLDVNLGDMSGLEVFEVLRRDHPELPVIFSTGHADAAALDDVRRRRVPAIMKPYEIGDLVAIIEQLGEPVTAHAAPL